METRLKIYNIFFSERISVEFTWRAWNVCECRGYVQQTTDPVVDSSASSCILTSLHSRPQWRCHHGVQVCSKEGGARFDKLLTSVTSDINGWNVVANMCIYIFAISQNHVYSYCKLHTVSSYFWLQVSALKVIIRLQLTCFLQNQY
jgi:hypothetical protein